MSLVFLFGAGASYGSGDCSPCPPPLGYKLFQELRLRRGIAASIEDSLATLFEDNFEKGMREFARLRGEDVTTFQRELAAYFCQFTPGPNNYYKQLVEILRRSKKKAVFATTNYEMLIEEAIMLAGGKVVIPHPAYLRDDCKFPDPSLSPNTVPVLKIHGSCNFLPETYGVDFQNVGFSFADSDTGTGAFISGPAKAVSRREALRFCQQEDSLAPAIAMYAEGKRVHFCPEVIKNQQKVWQKLTKEAMGIYLIGIRVYPVDTHIWDVIASAKGWLRYVGREPDEFRQWCVGVKRKNYYAVASSFEEALPVIKRQMCM